jgi:hypothetical protein
MTTWNAYRDDIVFSFRKHKELAEKAVVQLNDDLFLRRPGEHSNSVAIIVEHLAWGLRSLWTTRQIPTYPTRVGSSNCGKAWFLGRPRGRYPRILGRGVALRRHVDQNGRRAKNCIF